MATPAVDDIWQLRVGCYSPVQAGINVVNYKILSIAGGGLSDVQLATSLDALLESSYKAAMSVSATYYGVSLQRISPLPKTAAVIIDANEGAGTVAGDILPLQVSGLFSFQTLLAGPKYRGRIYIPFPGEASNDTDGTPTGAYRTLVAAIAADLFQVSHTSGGQTTNINPVIWHRATGTSTECVGGLVRAKWATQRRRGAYGRVNAPPF